MRFFFRTWKDINLILKTLKALNCPRCGVSGALIRHGFLKGFMGRRSKMIRGRRIRCKKSARRNGCNHTFSLRLAGTLPRRCFKARGLWAFIQRLRDGLSVKAAWEQSGIPLTLDSGYAVYRRLQLCQSILRTQLCNRSPPEEEKGEGSSLFQMFNHLEKTFSHGCAVRAYQEKHQKDFLAIA